MLDERLSQEYKRYAKANSFIQDLNSGHLQLQ